MKVAEAFLIDVGLGLCPTGFLQTYIHCHRQQVESTEYTKGVRPNRLSFSLTFASLANVVVCLNTCATRPPCHY